ncbi:MAG: beta-hydroxyacyl-ACP dehydratase [Phycisphaeraceae bacterium]|nr:beta-hydroxyacyl-ACP dehydratase [Phycisphaeraceae bacterium]
MRWLWIDRITDLIAGERASAIKAVSLAEEHLHDHFEGDPSTGRSALPVMPGTLILEGMAQTAGILVGYSSGFREKVVLAKVVRADLSLDALPGHVIRYDVRITQISPQGAATAGDVWLSDAADLNSPPRRLGTIDLIFSHIDQNMAGSEFGDHNFVFGESFWTLLRLSGVQPPSA